jgi:hypothetical protein
MKLIKALIHAHMARSGAEANRMVKQNSVWVGGCIEPCNKRVAPYVCTCGNWKKVTNPVEDIPAGTVIRVKDGNWRLLTREDGRQGFDQVAGIARVPSIINDEIQ